MSALVMVRKADRVELLSDAALYDPMSGVLGAIHSKLAPLPELNCVLCARGPIPVLWITAYVAGLRAVTFDDVVENFPAIQAEAASYRGRDIPAEQWGGADIGLIGWSESRDRPEAYMSSSKGLPETGLTTGSLNPCDVGVFASGSIEVANAFVEGVRTCPEAFDAETSGIAVIELMRREAAPLNDGPDAYVGHSIGGFIEHATVTRGDVSVRTIHRWPDEVGRRIRPLPSIVDA